MKTHTAFRKNVITYGDCLFILLEESFTIRKKRVCTFFSEHAQGVDVES